MLTKICLAMLLPIFAAGLPVCGQLRVGIDGDIPMTTLEQMQDNLGFANAQQRMDLFVHLGIDAITAKTMADAWTPSMPTQFRPLRTGMRESMGLIFVPDGPSGTCFLFLLEHSETKSSLVWRVVDRLQPDSWDHSVSLEIAQLRRDGEDDIILHHVDETHGTVFVAGETQVFSVFFGKLVRTLATEDFRNEDRLGEDQKARAEASESRFQRLPGHVWEETRTQSVNGEMTKAERRRWRWSNAELAFHADSFTPLANE